MKNEEQRSKPYRGTRRRLQMAADRVYRRWCLHCVSVRGALRLQSQTTALDDHQVNNDRRRVNSRQSIFSIRCHSLRPSIILRQRSQLSAALTLISQLSNKSKCISTHPFASGYNTTTSLPKPSKGVHRVVYAVYEENPFTNVHEVGFWVKSCPMFHSVFQNFSDRVKMIIP